MGESLFTSLHYVRSFFSREGLSVRKETHATDHEKRHGSSGKRAKRFCLNGIFPESCNDHDPPDGVPPDRNDAEKTCIAEALTLRNERVPDVRQLPLVQGLIFSMWIADPG